MTSCDHVKVYGRHFEQEDWARWTASAGPSLPSPPPPPPEPATESAPPVVKRPKPTICKKKAGTCKHVIAFGDHFNRSAWEKYANYVNEQHALNEVDN